MTSISEIRARCEAATPGPWYAKSNKLIGGFSVTNQDIFPHEARVLEVALFPNEADAEFIAHAREDIPYLLSELERTQAELAAEREEKLPVKEGDTVYVINGYVDKRPMQCHVTLVEPHFWVSADNESWGGRYDADVIGGTVFLTRAEAEAAQAGEVVPTFRAQPGEESL